MSSITALAKGGRKGEWKTEAKMEAMAAQAASVLCR